MAIFWYTSPGSGERVALEFDATIIETPSFTAEVTEHPVEDGVSISDHVRRNLTRLALEVVVTNTPIYPSRLGSSAAKFGGNAPLILTTETRRRVSAPVITGGDVWPITIPGTTRPFTPVNVEPAVSVVVPGDTVTVSALQFPFAQDRVKLFFDELESLINNGTPLVVDTYLKSFPSMVLTSMTPPREGKDSINFSLDLVEFRTASVQTTTVTKRKPAQKRAKVAVAAGPKGTGYPPTDRDQKDLESLERRLVSAQLQSDGGIPR